MPVSSATSRTLSPPASTEAALNYVNIRSHLAARYDWNRYPPKWQRRCDGLRTRWPAVRPDLPT
jgi:hypothetical protein